MAYTTRALIKTRLAIGSTTEHDTAIDNWISAATSWINNETGRVFEAATDTKYFTPLTQANGGNLSEDYRTLWVSPFNLVTITTLTNGDSTTVASSKYVLLPANNAPYYGIRLKSDAAISWTYSTAPENAISIAGTWGWSAAVPAVITEATEQVVVYWYQNQKAGGNAGQATVSGDGTYLPAPRLPKDLSDLLCAYRRKL